MAAGSTTWLETFELVGGGGVRWSEEYLCYNPTINTERVTLRGQVADGAVQQVRVMHLALGRVVSLDLVNTLRGSFEAPLTLSRGINEVVISPFDASDRSFSFHVVLKTSVREWVETLVCAVIFALIIKTFIIQPFYIPSRSMGPTLQPGDRIMVNRLDYLFRSPRRGDVVVFEHDEGARWSLDADEPTSQYFIKRIVGLPSEELRILDRQVFLGGVPLQEPYVAPDDGLPRVSALGNYDPIVLPESVYFVLGDNRDYSADSRSWGGVARHTFVGRAAFVWYPMSRMRWLP